MSKTFSQYVKLLALSLLAVLGVGYVVAWVGPSSVAPNGNVDAPINVGGGTVGNTYIQTKTGILNLLHLITSDLTVTNSDGSTSGIASGSVLMADGDNTGKTKWGSIVPGEGMYFSFTSNLPLITSSYWFSSTVHNNTGGTAWDNNDYKPVPGRAPNLNTATPNATTAYQSIDTKPFTNGKVAKVLLVKVHCVEAWVYIYNSNLILPSEYASNFSSKQYNPNIVCYATDNRSVVQDAVVYPDSNGFIKWQLNDIDTPTYYTAIYLAGYAY